MSKKLSQQPYYQKQNPQVPNCGPYAIYNALIWRDAQLPSVSIHTLEKYCKCKSSNTCGSYNGCRPIDLHLVVKRYFPNAIRLYAPPVQRVYKHLLGGGAAIIRHVWRCYNENIWSYHGHYILVTDINKGWMGHKYSVAIHNSKNGFSTTITSEFINQNWSHLRTPAHKNIVWLL